MSAIEDRLLVLIVDLHSSVSRHVCLVGVDLPLGPRIHSTIVFPHVQGGKTPGTFVPA